VDFFRPVEHNGQGPFEVGLGPNLWPSSPAGLKDMSESYICYLENLGNQVLKAMAIGLGIDDEVFISRVNTAFWNLRILGYEGRKAKSSEYAGIGQHTGTSLFSSTRDNADDSLP